MSRVGESWNLLHHARATDIIISGETKRKSVGTEAVSNGRWAAVLISSSIFVLPGTQRCQVRAGSNEPRSAGYVFPFILYEVNYIFMSFHTSSLTILRSGLSSAFQRERSQVRTVLSRTSPIQRPPRVVLRTPFVLFLASFLGFHLLFLSVLSFLDPRALNHVFPAFLRNPVTLSLGFSNHGLVVLAIAR